MVFLPPNIAGVDSLMFCSIGAAGDTPWGGLAGVSLLFPRTGAELRYPPFHQMGLKSAGRL